MIDIPAPRLAPSGRLDSPREVVRQFTPNWFAASMGTGVLALVLARAPTLRPLAEGLWAFNIGLFALFCLLYAARWIAFFDGARRIFDHPVASMFLGCIPMALATIVNGLVVFGPTLWPGGGAVEAALGLWRLDAVLALAVGLAVPLAMFTRQDHAIEQMTAVWLLPVVAAEVAGASAGLLAPHLPLAHDRLDTLIAGYVLWACSTPMALGLLVILVLRMTLHKLPDPAQGATTWLALGPIGTGALGLMLLGEAAPAILAANGLWAYGAAARGVGLIGGLLLWGYGLWWLAMAGLITLRHLRRGLPFNLSWWAYTFPLGVYTLATLQLANLLPIHALAVLGQALAALLTGLWLVVVTRTARGAWRGELLHAPCLAD